MTQLISIEEQKQILDRRKQRSEYMKDYYKKRGGRGKYVFVLNIPEHNVHIEFKTRNEIMKHISKQTKPLDKYYSKLTLI